MHAEAYDYVFRAAAGLGPGRVVEFGGRMVNMADGKIDESLSLRPLFNGDYLSLDVAPGHGVDIVADAATWRAVEPFDVVVCCEVLEHTDQGAAILESAWHALRPGGHAIFTMATDPRAPHSGVDGGTVRPGEYYGNVSPQKFLAWATGFDVVDLEVDTTVGDLRAVLRRPTESVSAEDRQPVADDG